MKNNELLIEKAYLNGEFVESYKTFDVINPATGETIGKVPDLPMDKVEQAIADAEAVWPAWRKMLVGERSKLL